MSLLWKTAVQGEDLPVTIDSRPLGDPLKNPKYLVEARVPDDHPSAAEHGTLAGYAHCEDRYHPEHGYVPHVHMIETNPAYARKGVAGRIMEHVISTSDSGKVTHDGMTDLGAELWKAVTGEHLVPTRWADRNNARNWRHA